MSCLLFTKNLFETSALANFIFEKGPKFTINYHVALNYCVLAVGLSVEQKHPFDLEAYGMVPFNLTTSFVVRDYS